MPPARRPSRPVRPPAGGGKKPPYALIGAIAGGVALVVVLILVFAGGGSDAPPPPPRTSAVPKRVSKLPQYTVHLHQLDTGTSRKITVLVSAKGGTKPADFTLKDASGKTYSAEKASVQDLFRRQLRDAPGAVALSFRAPRHAGALELVLPDGKTRPVSRLPGKLERLPATTRYEDWLFKASGAMKDGKFELTIDDAAAEKNPLPWKPEELYALTDTGRMLSPRVAGKTLTYDVPKDAKEILVQVGFRDPEPRYLAFSVGGGAPVASAPKAAAPKPAPKPAPKGPDVKAEFAKRSADVMSALKYLVDKPAAKARPLAREAVARAIAVDVDAGMKAYQAGDASLAEKHLARAALLADPYHPEFSRQLMRMLFLLKKPRRTPTGCSACKGHGALDCGDCTEGRALGDCPRCETKGTVNCLLCDAAGTLNHHGYRGKIQLQLTRDRQVRNEKGQKGVLHSGTIVYTMSPCSGRGQFNLKYDTVTNCRHYKNQKKTSTVQQPCSKFWTEMKLFVFSGRAKVRIPDKTGKFIAFSPISARRFFADFEKCKTGSVTCDRCLGKKRDACSLCSGKGKANVLCATCEGTTLHACATCKGYGDSAWLKKILPAAPELTNALGEQALALRNWLDARARIASNKEILAVRLNEAQKGLDATAKLTPDMVEVKCPRCRGNGSACQECWATGRREFHAGTAVYEQHAIARRLEKRLANVQKAVADVPHLADLPSAESSGAAAAKAPAPPPPVPPRPQFREVAVPSTVEEMIRKADELYKTGLGHLQKSKGASDNAAWIDQGYKALEALRNAQTLYATAQETLDAKGLTVPRTLLKKFRVNMQALVMARKQLP